MKLKKFFKKLDEYHRGFKDTEPGKPDVIVAVKYFINPSTMSFIIIEGEEVNDTVVLDFTATPVYTSSVIYDWRDNLEGIIFEIDQRVDDALYNIRKNPPSHIRNEKCKV